MPHRHPVSRKVMLQIPVSLLTRTDALAKEMRIDRSKLIRQAVEEKVEHLEQEQLQLELKEGYIANAHMLRQTHEDFQHIVDEALSGFQE